MAERLVDAPGIHFPPGSPDFPMKSDPLINQSSVKGTFSFVSLGCPKNLVDSERMLGLLAQDGYVLVPDAQKADLVIVNTCGFIDAARQESLGVIREMIDRKKE